MEIKTDMPWTDWGMRQVIKWNRDARLSGRRQRVSPVLEASKELVEPRRSLFRLIGQTSHLDWLLLFRRPDVALANWPLWCGYWCGGCEDSEMVRYVWRTYIMPNIWVGTTIEDQQRADERIPLLVEIPARVRFLSCENLAAPIDLKLADRPEIHWVVIDSAPGRQVQNLAEQCKRARVACHVKDGSVQQFPIPGRANLSSPV